MLSFELESYSIVVPSLSESSMFPPTSFDEQFLASHLHANTEALQKKHELGLFANHTSEINVC
jgi:hypothetical protein